MGNPLDQLPIKNYALLVTLSWAGTTPRYISYTSDLVIGETTYTAVPALAVEFPEFNGGVERSLLKVSLPTAKAPATFLSRPYPSPLVTVSVDEVDPTDPSSTRRALFQGTVLKVYRNPNGLPNLLTLEVGNALTRLDALLGLMALTTCPWNFGDTHCGKDLDLLKVSTTIFARDGVSLTLNYVTSEIKYWHRGYVIKDGISIMIRDANYSELTLMRLPPPEWAAGNSIVVIPGCDKTIETCRSRWSNESQFAGCGYAMPGYSPVFETEA